MREQRQLPSIRFFFVEDKMDDFAQCGIRLLVVLLQLLFQLGNGESDRLEENCFCWIWLLINFH